MLSVFILFSLTVETQRKVKHVTANKSRSTNLDSLREVSVMEKNSQANENPSVITKTRNPKVVVNTETINEENNIWCQCCYCRHKFIISLCLIVMWVVMLATFFISLKTYNIINSLLIM